MEKLHSLPKLVLDSEEARSVQQQYDHLIVEMDQFEKATVEVIAFNSSCRQAQCALAWFSHVQRIQCLSLTTALPCVICLRAVMSLQDWCNLISAISDQKLKQPLMSQDPQGNVLRVNFDPALVRLLRETRYFLLLPDLPIEIPANALKVRLPL